MGPWQTLESLRSQVHEQKSQELGWELCRIPHIFRSIVKKPMIFAINVTKTGFIISECGNQSLPWSQRTRWNDECLYVWVLTLCVCIHSISHKAHCFSLIITGYVFSFEILHMRQDYLLRQQINRPSDSKDMCSTSNGYKAWHGVYYCKHLPQRHCWQKNTTF